MYEYISGKLTELAPTYAVVEAAGVGYYLNISLQTFSAIENQNDVRLYVHFVVREDAQLLYGFASKIERELFRNLISVSGVGGNTARMILSTYSSSELRNIIATENAVLLKNVKGLGLKTAQKIIVELSGKMLELNVVDGDQMVVGKVDAQAYDETLSALQMLGFQRGVSEKVVKAIFKESPSISVEDAVRQALRRM
ncbi:MAG: Holliday junction branch migration protein RuvA [Alistipes sp.]|nr:Holliday junction branch migration protein RuvA [Alistipes sp.]MBQ4127445.1 Holliday junction branch migration protein RuvA [Alistipes sp.]